MGREECGRLSAVTSKRCVLPSPSFLFPSQNCILIHRRFPLPSFFFPLGPLFFLFSSDEPAEVAVVKTAIIQHLELDSKITLSVLCDQIVPPDEPIEGDDKVTRERLRTLVVAFLAEDARRPLLIKLQGQGDSCVEQEQALIDTLLKVTDPLFPNQLSFGADERDTGIRAGGV
jgi:hypothetical protein